MAKKITKDELKSVQDKVSLINNAQMQIGGLEVQKTLIVEKLKARIETYAATMAEPLLRVPNTVWTEEKKAHMNARRKTGNRRFPGVPVIVADWWDTEEEMTKNMQSKL